MAFNFTSMARKVLDVLGVATRAEYGIGVLSGGALVVKTTFEVVEVAFASSQTSNAARISDITAGSFTITGTGTDAVMWLAIGKGGR
jgi:hypothetical protein